MIAAEGRRKPLPDPPKFTGKRKEYAAWSQQMRNKIRLDKRFFGGNEDIWYYINARLDYGPQQVVATFYAAGGPGGLYNPQEFLGYLDQIYKDLNIYN